MVCVKVNVIKSVFNFCFLIQNIFYGMCFVVFCDCNGGDDDFVIIGYVN